eukprot:m.349462 g.349462  ORF g.349462 m.349462 type:complete len:53 (+) comp16150_c0_seq17:24-182(+)
MPWFLRRKSVCLIGCRLHSTCLAFDANSDQGSSLIWFAKFIAPAVFGNGITF